MAPDLPAIRALTFTGERFTPEERGPIWYEHWHRYAEAAHLARGKRVLDAASGEGYGSFLLADGARFVVGIDISSEAVTHARARYARPNLVFTQASVTQLPLRDASIDLVISFETVEHLSKQREMLAEFRRVLAPDGVLVISSPNRPVYNEEAAVENHFHVKELDRAEFSTLLDPLFPWQAWFGQRVIAQSALWAEDDDAGRVAFTVLDNGGTVQHMQPVPPMYFVVVAAAEGVTLPRLPFLSLFDDGALTLWRSYASACDRQQQSAWRELEARKDADKWHAKLIVAVNDLASERQKTSVLVPRLKALETELAHSQAELGRTKHGLYEANDAFARESAAYGEVLRRLAYRESIVGWLRFPFAALKRRLARTG
ncbi:MAG: class I SAM-dependent methyltransferase [Casimicrobiaceae bacterium]